MIAASEPQVRFLSIIYFLFKTTNINIKVLYSKCKYFSCTISGVCSFWPAACRKAPWRGYLAVNTATIITRIVDFTPFEPGGYIGTKTGIQKSCHSVLKVWMSMLNWINFLLEVFSQSSNVVMNVHCVCGLIATEDAMFITNSSSGWTRYFLNLCLYHWLKKTSQS